MYLNCVCNFFHFSVVTLVNCGILPKKNFQNVHLFHPFVNSLSLPRTSAAKTVAEPCDENQLNFCATNLAKALNLTSFPENAAVFFYDIISIVYNGIKGFEDSCKYNFLNSVTSIKFFTC